jgi:hypothetical protein
MAVLGILALIAIVLLFGAAMANLQNYRSDYENDEPDEDFYVLAPFEENVEVNRRQKAVYQYLESAKRATFKQLELAAECTKADVDELVFLGVLKEIKTSRTILPAAWRSWGIGLLSVVGIGLLFYLANYYVMVRVNLRYLGILFYVGFFVILATAYIGYFVRWRQKDVLFVASSVIGLVMITVLFYAVFGGRTYLHSAQYADLMEVEEKVFSSDVETVDVASLPIVDKAYGEKLGTIKLGEYPALGSEFEVGAYSDIIYQGEQYLVAPLEYRDIFKWFGNRDLGTPGYLMVNKVTTETTLVNLREQTGQGMIYTPSAYFNDDLTRHAYFNGMHQYRLEASFFEIDESGHPYFILQYSVPTIFINGGSDIVKIAVVDAVTGDVAIYDPTDVPDWVESVYPPDLLLTHLDYWGGLQDGWLNRLFAQRGVLQSSAGKRTVMNGGELFYFTGLTSAGGDESTIGFVYMSTRTKETMLYKFPGATEEAAMRKALTLLPQNNISTSFPIPINVDETPTYFIAIKGEDGRILRHVFMSVQNLELYGIADTKARAYTNYLQELGATSNNGTSTVSGIITGHTSYVLEGNTIYWVQLDDDLWYLIDVSTFGSSVMRYFIALEIGDSIELVVQDFTVLNIVVPE